MPFPIDLQKIMARTQILVKNSDFFTNGLLLVIHLIYHLLVMIWKLLHHLKHPRGQWVEYRPKLRVYYQIQLGSLFSVHLSNS